MKHRHPFQVQRPAFTSVNDSVKHPRSRSYSPSGHIRETKEEESREHGHKEGMCTQRTGVQKISVQPWSAYPLLHLRKILRFLLKIPHNKLPCRSSPWCKSSRIKLVRCGTSISVIKLGIYDRWSRNWRRRHRPTYRSLWFCERERGAFPLGLFAIVIQVVIIHARRETVLEVGGSIEIVLPAQCFIVREIQHCRRGRQRRKQRRAGR